MCKIPIRLRWLYPVECLLIFFSAVVMLLYFWFGLSDRNAFNFYFEQLRTVAYGYPLALLVVFVCVFGRDGYERKRQGLPPSEKAAWLAFRSSYFNVRVVFRHLRCINAIMITFVLFAHMKHLTPFLNSALYDAQLLAFERWLFGGKVAFELMDSFIPRSMSDLIGTSYQAYYIYLSIFSFIFILQKDAALAQRFCVAFSLLWIVGIGMVYLYPTWGPCFFVPDIYASLYDGNPNWLLGTLENGEPHAMQQMQSDLWAMKLELDQNRMSDAALFSISGLPSLHLAVVVLGSLMVIEISRILALISWAFAVATFVSTLYFGWHYLLDDVFSLVLVGLVLLLTRFYLHFFVTPGEEDASL